MGSSIIEGISSYSSTITFTQTAAINDVIVIGIAGGGVNHGTATMTGATGTFTEQQYGTSTSGVLTLLTAPVTASGVPVVTIAGPTDIGGVGWICRGLTNGTKDVGGTAGGTTANPLTVSLAPSVTCSLFCMWASENLDNFTSFTEAVATRAHNTTHYHAYGEKLDMASGSYAPGANLTGGSTGQGIVAIFLPMAGVAPPYIGAFARNNGLSYGNSIYGGRR